jgi:anthranilate/para-aminobenzoate synthase component I
MTVQNDSGTYPVGGGIVWDSDPLEEWHEAQQKGKILASFLMDVEKNIALRKLPAQYAEKL